MRSVLACLDPNRFRLRRLLLDVLILAAWLCSGPPASAALLEVWRAESITLDDGDAVGTWVGLSNRFTANGASAEQPTFRRNATPAGTSAVRFNGAQRLTAGSPVAGRTAFSVALVFRADAHGANIAPQWYGKTGLVDAEEPGVTADWGVVLTETGQVGIGTGGASDNSLYSTGASLADSNYHAAVFTWGAGVEAVYVDSRPAASRPGVSSLARNNAGISLGGIRTGELDRRLKGDLVEIRFYDTALSATQATNVIAQLKDDHILGIIPRIRSFAATPQQIYLGASSTLSWDVTNVASVTIDQELGAFGAQGSIAVRPTVTTTYTLTATNTNGVRIVSATVQVDPGVPLALNLTTNTTRNVPLALTLQGTDPNDGALSYAIGTPPAHGTLTGAPPNLTYTPFLDFVGLDSFTFRVNDGAFDSAPATVSIKVIPPPTPPTGVVLTTTDIPAGAGPGAFIAALRAIDPNEGDTQSFTLVPGFGANSNFIVSGNLLSAGPTFSGGPGVTFPVRIRATDQTGFSIEQSVTLRVVDRVPPVVINEIHYNPDRNPIRESFLEIYNASDAPVDLSLWRVRGGIDFFFPSGTILGPRAFLVLAEDPATLASGYQVEAFGPWDGGLDNEGEEITLRDALDEVIDSVDFRSEFPWPISANGQGPSAQLVHPGLDNDLGSSWRSAFPPTPGTTNAVFATNAPPNIRQVAHSPEGPRSTDLVTIHCKVTDPDGVASVTLAYQLVTPGQFIPATLPLTAVQLNALDVNPRTNLFNPTFEASTNWTTVTMHDDGLEGDEVAGDGVYGVTLAPQANRTLVRYRITSTDGLGAARRAPFEDDPSLNFAYFVYDGVPSYLGHSSAALQTLPVYFLITRDADINQCAGWFSSNDQLPQGVASGRNEGRLHFNWEGAFVYENKVYDHITYRLRGANGRYHAGKRSFRFRFNDGRPFDAKDYAGRPYPTKWRELTTGKGQSNRGSESFALNEVVNYFLWNKVSVPAPLAHHFHFRVVRGAQESPTNQFAGDFWGLNWAQEKYDVNFLESHGLPRGNLYKLVDNYVLGVDERRYQAPFAVTNAQDFVNLENNLTGLKSVEWLLAHANYTNWYRYFTVAEAIRHYDIWPSANKNGAWYFEPIYTPKNGFLGRVMQLPYDSTDTWGPTWNNGEDILFNGIFPSDAGGGGDPGQHPELQLEYRNVVRELRALLFQPDQISAVIDAHAGLISQVVPADLARWSNAPRPACYRDLMIPNTPGVVKGLAGEVQDMKSFMFSGGNNAWWIDRTAVGNGGWITRLDAVAADPAAPTRPTTTYIGTNGYPVDGLLFQSSPFSDPQGAGSFSAMQWRLAEIVDPGTAVTNPGQLRLEYDAAWISPELAPFNEFITIPPQFVQPPSVYRVRVRHKDDTGRWSAWSLPVEFRPEARDVTSAVRTNLVFNEILFNPPAEGPVDGDEFEYVELKNIGITPLDLAGLFFSDGIEFTFPPDTTLAAGALFLLARNPAAFTTRYPGTIVQGVYTGRLNNDGETLAISHPTAGEIVSLTYGDRAPWPATADGLGFSITLADPLARTYRASASRLGTPGVDGGASTIEGVVVNEVLSSSTSPTRDTIELLNHSAHPVDISGWYLTDDPGLPQKYRIPARPALAPGAFALFTENDFNPNLGVGVSFALSSLGDQVYVFSADEAGLLTGYSHGFSFGAAQDGVSFGRYLNSSGEEQFPPQVVRTPGVGNAGPRVGRVVISEIHFHPRAAADEFIELRNPTPTAVAAFDPENPTNTWRLNGAGLSFPASFSIPPNGTVLLVSDHPVAFRARFAVPDSVPILQYSGNLQDDGENLELQAPDPPTADGIPYYSVDSVRYNDRAPWPVAADGAGASLQRLQLRAYADDPINWIGALPTPGSDRLTGAAPSITESPVSTTNVAGTTATFHVAAQGEPLSFQWRFNGANLSGATNETLVLSNLILTQAGSYSVLVVNRGGWTESDPARLVVRAGPAITSQPTNVFIRVPPDALARATNRATFSVTGVSYNPPLRYQWFYDGTPIPDATNSTYGFTNVTLAHEGDYSVLITDSVGPIHSAPARLTGLITPMWTATPISQSVATNAVVSFSAAMIGHPPPFTWDWRRSASTNQSATNPERSSYFTFVNTNQIGSVQLYLVNVRGLSGGAIANANLTTLADADHDGLPDNWEAQFGLDPTNAVDAALDLDQDGVPNGSEYTAGTDPSNAASFLKVALSAQAGQAAVSLNAASNKTYSIQYSDTFGPLWSKLADIPARTNDHLETIPDPTWTTNRFYRALTPRRP